jgi:Fe-S cluster biogenesis protein NfuA/nitrite reductase/ring-hydroxylating ferredoxin subunit
MAAVAEETVDGRVHELLELHAEGLQRVFAALDDDLRDRLAEDEVVASMLLLHGLYPVPLEARVLEALDSVRPYMESHGGNVELLGIEDGIARLRLEGSCKSCRASSSTLELAVRQALESAAPDLEGMDVEGVAEEPPAISGTPLPLVEAKPGWHSLTIPAPEMLAATHVDGVALVVANVDGTLLAYRNSCAECGGTLDGGALVGGALSCPGCGRRFSLPQAGRSMDDERLQLQPVPLLHEQEEIKVAL